MWDVVDNGIAVLDLGQFAENWLRDKLPNKFRQIVFHVRQIVFRKIVPYTVFAPAKRLK